MPVLNVNSINKKFGNHQAVSNVSFTVESGKIYGILGPNGAGKTTTIRMIMNIIAPDSGSITLFDQKMNESLKAKMGYLPEERGLYPKMKVLDHLVFLGKLNGLSQKRAKEASVYWLEKLDFIQHKDKTVEELSKGMQQKIQLIGALLHNPQLLILDEPFSGLDPVNAKLIKDILLTYKSSGKAIMLSTHMMDTAEKLCDEVLMINKGIKVLDGRLADIKKDYGHNSVHLEFDGNGSFIQSLEIVKKVNQYGNYMEVTLKDNVRANDLIKAVVDKVEVSKAAAKETTLNEIFIELAGGDGAENEYEDPFSDGK
jgi:ABC-2 type transport system ATP-binding protein